MAANNCLREFLYADYYCYDTPVLNTIIIGPWTLFHCKLFLNVAMGTMSQVV